MNTYQTIGGEGTACYEIQKSRFITHAMHVENEEAAREYLARQKKKYFDARHNCSAWILGARGDRQKSNDDGEPGGTAGNPILEGIRKRELTDVIVVVTRYFGGIKLGAGGLIRAYGHAAALGLEAAGIVAMTPFRQVHVICDYTLFNTIDHFLRQKKIRMGDAAYAEKVAIPLFLPSETSESILRELTDLTAARCQYEDRGEITIPVPLIDSAAHPPCVDRSST